MPHRCVNCGAVYEDGSATLLKGCSCGGHFFFFFKKEHLEEVNRELADLSKEDADEIEQDVRGIIGSEVDDKPVILDFESIRVTSPGKFEIDLTSLFKRKPVIYKMEEGRYVIDIASVFDSVRKDRK